MYSSANSLKHKWICSNISGFPIKTSLLSAKQNKGSKRTLILMPTKQRSYIEENNLIKKICLRSKGLQKKMFKKICKCSRKFVKKFCLFIILVTENFLSPNKRCSRVLKITQRAFFDPRLSQKTAAKIPNQFLSVPLMINLAIHNCYKLISNPNRHPPNRQ